MCLIENVLSVQKEGTGLLAYFLTNNYLRNIVHCFLARFKKTPSQMGTETISEYNLLFFKKIYRKKKVPFSKGLTPHRNPAPESDDTGFWRKSPGSACLPL